MDMEVKLMQRENYWPKSMWKSKRKERRKKKQTKGRNANETGSNVEPHVESKWIEQEINIKLTGDANKTWTHW